MRLGELRLSEFLDLRTGNCEGAQLTTSTVPLRSLVIQFLSVLSNEAPPISGVYFESLIFSQSNESKKIFLTQRRDENPSVRRRVDTPNGPLISKERELRDNTHMHLNLKIMRIPMV